MSFSLPSSFHTNLHFCYNCTVQFSLFPFNTIVFLDTYKFGFFFNRVCTRVCVCVCVHVLDPHGHMCTVSSSVTLHLSFEDSISPRTWTILASYAGWPIYPVCCCLPSPGITAALGFFPWVLGEQTQVLTRGQQTPYQLSHLSSPVLWGLWRVLFSSFCKCPSVCAVFFLTIWYTYRIPASIPGDNGRRQKLAE